MRKELKRDEEEGDEGGVWKNKSPGVQFGSTLVATLEVGKMLPPPVLSILIQGWGVELNDIRKHSTSFSCSQHNAQDFGKPLQIGEDALYIRLEPQFSPWGTLALLS